MKLELRFLDKSGWPCTLHEVGYHRNGIGGVGFYIVSLHYNGDSYLAISFESTDKALEEQTRGTIAVIKTWEVACFIETNKLSDITPLRGCDHFGDAVREAIALYNRLTDIKLTDGQPSVIGTST